MGNSIIRAAIAYDFDGTLAPGNMQEHSFIPQLGIAKEAFWAEANALARENDMDEILAYMELMLKKSKEKGIPILRQEFVNYGKYITFFPGIEDYFDRINAYAMERDVQLDHHIISSGLREFISGTPIARHFRNIFASGFKYNKRGIADWAALAINYTNKTQYLFRINKGIDNAYDNKLINKHIPEHLKPIPFSRMIYIGDGETDVPAMKMLKYQGGATIAVYNPDAIVAEGNPPPRQLCQDLIRQNRVDYIAPTDYTEGSPLYRTICLLIDRIRINEELNRHQQ